MRRHLYMPVAFVVMSLLWLSAPAIGLAETASLPDGPQFRSTATDRQGHLHTLWVSENGPLSSLYYQIKDTSGSALTTPRLIAENSSRIRRPKLILTDQNVAHLLWQERSSNGAGQQFAEGTTIRYAMLSLTPVGVTPLLPRPITLTNDQGHRRVAAHPSLAVDQFGWAYVAWEEGKRDVILAVIDPVGKVVQRRQISRQATATDHAQPVVAVDRRGNVHVVWSAQTGEKTQIVYKAFRGHGGQVLAKDKIVYASQGTFAQTKVVTFNDKEEIKIAWVSQRGRSIRFATNAGSGYLWLRAGRMFATDPEVVTVVDQSIKSAPGRVWDVADSAVISQKPGLDGPASSVERVAIIDPPLRKLSSADQAVHKLLMEQLLRYASWSTAPPANGVFSTVPPRAPAALTVIDLLVPSTVSTPTALGPGSERNTLRSLNVSTQGGETVRISSEFIA